MVSVTENVSGVHATAWNEPGADQQHAQHGRSAHRGSAFAPARYPTVNGSDGCIITEKTLEFLSRALLTLSLPYALLVASTYT